jgi:hypothetical protein
MVRTILALLALGAFHSLFCACAFAEDQLRTDVLIQLVFYINVIL